MYPGCPRDRPRTETGTDDQTSKLKKGFFMQRGSGSRKPEIGGNRKSEAGSQEAGSPEVECTWDAPGTAPGRKPGLTINRSGWGRS